MFKLVALLVVLMYSSLCLADDTSTWVMPSSDNVDYFYRPCNDFSDLSCIAEYLAANSDCTINVGSMAEPHFRSQSDLFFPNFNMSLIQSDIYLSGINGEIIEFYRNTVTDKLVMAVNYTNLIINSTTATMTYQRVAKEPAVTVSSSYEIFPSLTITAVFDDVSEGLDFSKTTTTVNIPVMPYITFTDTVGYYPADSANIEAMWTEFADNIAIVIQEAFSTASIYYFWNFLQNDICDMDIPKYK